MYYFHTINRTRVLFCIKLKQVEEALMKINSFYPVVMTSDVTGSKAFRRSMGRGLILNFEADDVDAEYKRLRAAGLPIHLEFRSEDFGQCHFISSDPNGT